MELKMKLRFIVIVLFLFLLLSSIGFYLSQTTSNLEENKETLVFVHGAHLTRDSWFDVAKTLEIKGFKTLLVNLPGRNSSVNPNEITLNVSSKYLCETIKFISTPIVLVAHSQGGAISNNALSICPKKNIKSIIYIAAVSPSNGEKPFSLLNKADEFNYLKGINYDDSGWMVINNKSLFVNSFTNSESNAVRNKIIKSSVDEPAMIGEGIVSYDISYFAKINKFYIYTKFDNIISLASQKNITRNMNLKNSATLETGHLPMISSAKLLSNKIEGFLY